MNETENSNNMKLNNLNNMNSKDKFHFFIGNIFSDPEQIRTLKKIQKKLRYKYSLKNFHFNNRFFTNMIYLGYFDSETAALYMSNIIEPLLKAISNNINSLECNYTNFKLEHDKVYNKISLSFEDTHNQLQDIIMPYLYNNAIVPIYNKKNIIHKPMIDLIYYKDSTKVKSINNIKIQLPTEKFKINHISLIKGTPYHIRVGTPSIHDQMMLEEIEKYKFYLKD